jgi:hypothetical protein
MGSVSGRERKVGPKAPQQNFIVVFKFIGFITRKTDLKIQEK